MLSRRTYTDFGQFVAALKSAERLNLRYRAERREEEYTAKVAQFAPRNPSDLFGLPARIPAGYVDEQHTRAVYTLDILADDEAAGEATA